MDFVKLNIRGISYSQTQVGAYALILEEEFGGRKLPIIIGNFEAQAIAIALEKDLTPPRPLTHDLFVNFAKKLNSSIRSVTIYKLEDGIFYSNLVCEDKDGEVLELDSRTSDAIALAVRFKAPIYVIKSVLDRAGVELEMLTEEEEENVQQALKEIEDEISESLEPSQKEDYSKYSVKELKSMMNKAAKAEDYEKAAQIRDELDKRSQKLLKLYVNKTAFDTDELPTVRSVGSLSNFHGELFGFDWNGRKNRIILCDARNCFDFHACFVGYCRGSLGSCSKIIRYLSWTGSDFFGGCWMVNVCIPVMVVLGVRL